MDPTTLTMTELRDAIAGGRVAAADAVRAYLARIEAIDGELGACTQVFAERAVARATAVDSGEVDGPLAGVPIAVKENICARAGRTTCSSRMLENYRSPFDATVIERLESAGAIVIARTNMDEFAMGSSTESSALGRTRNPWSVDRVPGGSSGGSAAAVAARLCAAALGSDTGGSIRQPAAFCGVVGLKPTYGRVSRYGLVAYASSLDQIGPITRDVADAALMLAIIAGHDDRDSTSAPDHVGGGAAGFASELHAGVDGLRLGVPRQYLSDANDPAVSAGLDASIEALRSQGAEIVHVDLPHTKYGVPTYYIVATAEASSNLARYDGVHYGHRTANAKDLEDLYAASRAEGFGDEVKRRIMLGTYALSSGYYDAYYLRALKVRRLIKGDFDRAFESVDAIVCPTTPGPAFPVGSKTADPLTMYLEDIYTVNVNLAGLPAVSLPCALADVGGVRLPVGVQLIGPAFAESRLMRIGASLERSLGAGSGLVPPTASRH